jgi:hypothetical protein
MISYIIKDKNDIIGVYKKLDDAYDFIIFINNYINKKTNINNIIKNIKIYKYKNNTIKNIYYINSKLILSKTQECLQDNINNIDNINIKNIDNINNESSEINIFIPNELSEINDINMNELKEKIILLEKLKNNEYDKLQELKKDFINKEEKYIEDKIKINNKKLKLKQEQEKWDNIIKKFEADKKLYFLFKQEIENNIREVNDIPELYKNIYPIFEKLDNDKYLNTIQEINKYVELINN